MAYRYTLEILAGIAIVVFCALFLYTSATMSGAEFAGSDNVGSGLIAKLSGIPVENFQPLIPQWVLQVGKLRLVYLHFRQLLAGSWLEVCSGTGWARRGTHN